MKRDSKYRIKKMREGERRESMKEAGNVHLPSEKVHTPKTIKERHKTKRLRPHELDLDED